MKGGHCEWGCSVTLMMVVVESVKTLHPTQASTMYLLCVWKLRLACAQKAARQNPRGQAAPLSLETWCRHVDRHTQSTRRGVVCTAKRWGCQLHETLPGLRYNQLQKW